jgi:uncharacterized protein YlaI
MNRKVNALLNQLASADPNTPDFLDLSKQLASAVKVMQKEKSEKKNMPKTPKPKPVKTMLCLDCTDLLQKKLSSIIQSDLPEDL